MRVAIFGSTGRVGQQLVERALDRGWEVVAFARSPDKLGELRERTQIVEGDVQDAEAVRQAVHGVDAVLSAVGHTETSQPNVLTVTAKNIVEAMRRHEVERFVTLLGAGVQTELDPSSVGRTLMLTIMRWIAGEMLADAQRHADLVRESDRDWVIVRPPRLTDDAYTGDWRAGYLQMGPTARISRADVAAFMLDQVNSNDWVQEAPMVSN